MPATCRAEEPVLPIGVVLLRICDHLPEIVCRESLRVERIRKRDLRAGGLLGGRCTGQIKQTSEQGSAQQQRQKETRASKTSVTKAQSLCISCSYPATCPRLLARTTVRVNRLLLCLHASSCARLRGYVSTWLGGPLPPAGRGCRAGLGFVYRRRLGGARVNVRLAKIVFDVLVEWARRWRVVWEQRGGRVRCNMLAAGSFVPPAFQPSRSFVLFLPYPSHLYRRSYSPFPHRPSPSRPCTLVHCLVRRPTATAP